MEGYPPGRREKYVRLRPLRRHADASQSQPWQRVTWPPPDRPYRSLCRALIRMSRFTATGLLRRSAIVPGSRRSSADRGGDRPREGRDPKD